MAGIQLGDIIQVGKIVWELYDLGWTEELSAGTQYAEFGVAVKELAKNLDHLVRVVNNALCTFQAHLNPLAPPQWDFSSLNEIIGDYRSTVNECKALLNDNQQYLQGGSALRNIEWNLLVQPNATRLKDRILLHNSKVLFVLKPLEIDLLSRIHADLASRIDNVHNLVLRIAGVVVPDLQQGILQRENRSSFKLALPPQVEEKFQQAAEIGHPDMKHADRFPLIEGAEAFIIHFRNSTIGFRAGLFVEDRTPPAEQYLNLLKCVWIMGKLQSSRELTSLGRQSHWPSYIDQLDAELSRECWRFAAECPDQVLTPDLSSDCLGRLTIWPERTLPNILPPIHDEPEGMMDELMNVALSTPSKTATQTLRVLRGPNGKMRAFVSAVDRSRGGNERTDGRTLNFSIQSASLIPLYAVLRDQGPFNMILRTDSSTAQFTFAVIEELLQFQQALTGFKAYKYYSRANVLVTFVVAGQKNLRVEDAHLQLWIPKELEGKPSAPSNTVDSGIRSYQNFPAPGALSEPPSSNLNKPDSFFSSMRPSAAIGLGIRMSSPKLDLQSPTQRTGPVAINPPYLPRTPHDSPIPNSLGLSLSRSTSVSTLTNTSPSPVRRQTSASIFSSASNSSGNSSGRSTTTVVDHGSGHGYIHQKPLKPILVLLLKSKETQQLQQGPPYSFVGIQMDEDTAPNFERCRCHTRDGDACSIAAIERKRGETILAHRFEAADLDGWDVTKLGMAKREGLPQYVFRNLKRVTLTFPDPKAREYFGGKPCRCRLRTRGELKECIQEGHQGLFGEVKQIGRRALEQWNRTQDERRDLVIGQPMVVDGG